MTLRGHQFLKSQADCKWWPFGDSFLSRRSITCTNTGEITERETHDFVEMFSIFKKLNFYFSRKSKNLSIKGIEECLLLVQLIDLFENRHLIIDIFLRGIWPLIATSGSLKAPILGGHCGSEIVKINMFRYFSKASIFPSNPFMCRFSSIVQCTSTEILTIVIKIEFPFSNPIPLWFMQISCVFVYARNKKTLILGLLHLTIPFNLISHHNFIIILFILLTSITWIFQHRNKND